jgi:type II secretory pathway pseudopilin PulG
MHNKRDRIGPRFSGVEEDGYTMIEFLVVIIMTSILAGMFSQMLITSIDIYTDHNLRKTANIDSRRACDMLMRDVREWRSWQAAPTSSSLDFIRITEIKRIVLIITRYYYDDLRVGFDISGSQVTYSRDVDGQWSNDYLIIQSGVQGGTQFAVVSAGGKERVTMVIQLSVNNKPLWLRTTVFPRGQGG